MSGTHFRKSRILNLFLVLAITLNLTMAALIWSPGSAQMAWAAPDTPGAPGAPEEVGYTTITGSPLTIHVSKDGSYQVIHDGVDSKTPGQVYNTTWDEGDSGIFVWYDGKVMGPDFDNHDDTGTWRAKFYPWSNESQTAVSGSGTAADPWIVQTVLSYGDVDLTVDTSYVDGNEYFDIDWEICAPEGAGATFLGADLYLQGSDRGGGYYDSSTGAVGGRNEDESWFEIFIPRTADSHYHEGPYGSFWQKIATNKGKPGPGFNDSVTGDKSHKDNAAGLQWNFSDLTRTGGCYTLSAQWSFASNPLIPPTPPSISFQKNVGLDPTACAKTNYLSVPPDTEVTYCYEIVNTGSVSVMTHTLVDDQLGVIWDNHVLKLSPGDSHFITRTATITTTTTNTATWTVASSNGLDVSATDNAYVNELKLGDLPIIEPFTGQKAEHFIYGGTPISAGLTASTTMGIDPVGEGWLRLTNGDANQGGYAIYDKGFSSLGGIAARFQYATYGGTGAEGLSFFLLDGKTVDPQVGAFGGSLGYSDQNCPPTLSGLSNAYVGVGFDEFGNFSAKEYGGLCSDTSLVQSPDSVALRGSGNGTDGYNYLTHYTLPGGQSIDGVGRNKPRWVQIWIVDEKITVDVDLGSGFETVIDSFDLAGDPDQVAIPDYFKLGFAASTGTDTNYHEIRNLTVKRPADLSVSVTDNQTTTTPGQPIAYTIVVHNNDFNVVNGAAVVDNVPSSINNVSWTCDAAPGSRCHERSGTGNTLNTKVTLAKSGIVTFSLSGVVAGNPNAPLSNKVTVSPPYDITDIDESNNTYTDETNLSPWIKDDDVIVDEDSTNDLDVLDNDSDVDGDPLNIGSVGTPSQGGDADTDGSTITYTPGPDFVGTETFTYTVEDGQGGTSTGSISVQVNNVNDPPTANDDRVNAKKNDLQDRTFAVLGNDTDPDGDTLTVVAVSDSPHGTVAKREKAVSYLPDANFEGTDTFTYTVSDGFLRDTATVTVTVSSAPNTPPVAADDVATTPEDQAVTIDVLDNDSDPDGDTLGVLFSSNWDTAPLSGTVSTNGSTIVYTPAPDTSGVYSFTYRASDGEDETSATVVVTVTAVNDPPDAEDYPEVIVEEDTPVNIPVAEDSSDPEDDNLTVISVIPPDHGRVDIDKDGDGVSYIPHPDYNGEDSFIYIVEDDGGLTDRGTITLTVRAVNDAPTPKDDVVYVAYGTPRTIAVLGNDTDPEDDALTLVSVGAAISGTTGMQGNLAVYTPTASISGTVDFFAYTISDGDKTATAYVRVIISQYANQRPFGADDIVVTKEDTPVTIDVLSNDRDPEGDSLFVKTVGSGAEGTVGIQGNLLVYTPTKDVYGSTSFTYTLTDGSQENTAAVLVSVTSVNDAPKAGDDITTTVEETPVTLPVLLNDSDPDNNRANVVGTGTFYEDTLRVSGLEQPASGQVETDGYIITYTPALNFYGTDHFTYTLNDGSPLGNSLGSVAITVTNTNDDPYAGLYVNLISVKEKTKVLDDIVSWSVDEPDCYWDWFDLVCPEGDQLSITGVGQPRIGSVELAQGGTVITYTPDALFFLRKADVFTYTIRDGKGGVDTDFAVLLAWEWSIMLPFVFKDAVVD